MLQYRFTIDFELLLHSFDARLFNCFKSSNLCDDDTFAVFLAECLGLWKLGFGNTTTTRNSQFYMAYTGAMWVTESPKLVHHQFSFPNALLTLEGILCNT